MKALDQQLSELHPGLIEKMELNLQEEKILIKTAGFDDSDTFEVEFQGVKAFFFADPQQMGSRKHMPQKSLMAAIVYNEGGFGYFSATPQPQDSAFVSIPNFNVDFGHSSLFIEAEKIVINDHAYPLVQSMSKRYT